MAGARSRRTGARERRSGRRRCSWCDRWRLREGRCEMTATGAIVLSRVRSKALRPMQTFSARGMGVVHEPQGRRRESPCEVHFDWVLEGRAIQDVWIAPSRDERKPGEQSRMYGTTLRVYDPEKDLWHITWIDPVRQVCNRMTGRRVGDEIEQEYVEDGARYQWRFTEITPDSFHWIARKSGEDGREWNLIAEFFLRR